MVQAIECESMKQGHLHKNTLQYIHSTDKKGEIKEDYYTNKHTTEWS